MVLGVGVHTYQALFTVCFGVLYLFTHSVVWSDGGYPMTSSDAAGVSQPLVYIYF